MTERGTVQFDVAHEQTSRLQALLSTHDDRALKRPCPGREKLGDGTVAAVATHVVASYERIGGFVAATVRGLSVPAQAGHAAGHAGEATDVHDLTQALTRANEALLPLRDLSDEQLDSVPVAGAMRFCDGERTLEQVLIGLLRHQQHQLDAVARALA